MQDSIFLHHHVSSSLTQELEDKCTDRTERQQLCAVAARQTSKAASPGVSADTVRGWWGASRCPLLRAHGLRERLRHRSSLSFCRDVRGNLPPPPQRWQRPREPCGSARSARPSPRPRSPAPWPGPVIPRPRTTAPRMPRAGSPFPAAPLCSRRDLAGLLPARCPRQAVP